MASLGHSELILGFPILPTPITFSLTTKILGVIYGCIWLKHVEKQHEWQHKSIAKIINFIWSVKKDIYIEIRMENEIGQITHMVTKSTHQHAWCLLMKDNLIQVLYFTTSENTYFAIVILPYFMKQYTYNLPVQWLTIRTFQWHIKSPTTQLFVQQLLLVNNKPHIRTPCYWPFVRWIY